MTILINRCQVAAKIEGTEGEAESLAGANVLSAFEPKFELHNEPNKRKPKGSSVSPRPSVFGPRWAKVMFSVELVGTAEAGQSLPFSTLLRACGSAETVVASTSATLLPALDGLPSLTLGVYEDGVFYKFWGCRGKATLVLEAGKPGMFNFEFLAADWSKTDAPLLTSVSLGTVLPPTFQAAELRIGTHAATLTKVEIDFGGVVALQKDANASSCHKVARVSDRNPVLKIDPENVLVATHDFAGIWRAGTLLPFTTTFGTDEGNTFTITAPKVQYQDLKKVERDGVSAYEIEALLCGDDGDDEWQIAA